jgi:hypothetical protein
MSECKLDHSLEDVRNKLDEQSAFLLEHIASGLEMFLQPGLSQSTLNEVFHLLKKYDLSSEEEQVKRIQLINKMLER